MTEIQKEIILSYFKKKEIDLSCFYSFMNIYIKGNDLITIFFMNEYRSVCFSYSRKKKNDTTDLKVNAIDYDEILILKQNFKKTKKYQKIKLKIL